MHSDPVLTVAYIVTVLVPGDLQGVRVLVLCSFGLCVLGRLIIELSLCVARIEDTYATGSLATQRLDVEIFRESLPLLAYC